MSTIDLLILGILMKGAKNAYEVVRYIREKEVHRMIKISEPAVFKSCRRLAEADYLDGETVKVAGVPDKVVYAINDKGKERFIELMTHFSSEFKPFHLDVNTVLWNLDSLNKKDGLKTLVTIQKQIHEIKHWVTEHEEDIRDHLPFGIHQIVKQYRMTLTALAEWIDQAVIEYNG